jgi:lysophospholipase L1-like esterase
MSHIPRFLTRGLRLLVATATAVAAVLALGATASGAGSSDVRPKRYVALGDSFAAGPLLKPQVTGQPAGCGRSSVNYPHLLAIEVGLELADKTCSGATTESVRATQLAALTAETSYVTISIGANDINCGAWCSAIPGRREALINQVATTKWSPLLAEIKHRAPLATILLVGYGSYAPAGGCPGTPPVVARAVQGPITIIDGALRRQAEQQNIRYVDIERASLGHTACAPTGTRWFEPATSASDASPWHPTHAGMEGMARVLTEALGTDDPSGSAVIGDYVALGDSYTAGPMIRPMRLGAPPLCGRSAVNYPSQLAAELDLPLHDMSCAGASSDNVDRVSQGENPVQLSAVGSRTGLVTVSIGGNDEGLYARLMACRTANTWPYVVKNPCEQRLSAQVAGVPARTGQRVARILAAIHQRAPIAKVLVVGYPRISPSTGGCADLGFALGDYPWVDGVLRKLNQEIAAAARDGEAQFVDTYEQSANHHACAADPWVNGIRGGTDGSAAGHPNLKGMTAVTRAVAAALTK